MKALKPRLDDWKETNPLRMWRHRNELGLHDAAAVLQVSVSTMQVLEAGSRMPNGKMLQRIATGMGVTEQRLQSQWTKWAADRP